MASIKIRAKAKDGYAETKILMRHVMEPGLAKGKSPKYITRVNISLNGNDVIQSDFGPAVSKNPFISMKIADGKSGDKVKVSWTDNTGDSDSEETTIS